MMTISRILGERVPAGLYSYVTLPYSLSAYLRSLHNFLYAWIQNRYSQVSTSSVVYGTVADSATQVSRILFPGTYLTPESGIR